MNWFGYYFANTVALIIFGALTAWGLKRDWETVALVFGIALLLTGCNLIMRPA